MRFDSLPSLWFGLSLGAIVLLYLFKRKYADTPVSSHLLWQRVLKEMEANRPWQRLRNRLLLFVQLLAAAMLVLALMQPWVWAPKSAKAHVVLVMDLSASMTAAAGSSGGKEERLLERAKRLAAEWAEEEAGGSAITLLAMGHEADVALSRETDRRKLREALDRLEPAYGKTAYRETMSLASALTRQDPDSEVRLFTDGQFAESTSEVAFAVPVTITQVTADPETDTLGNMSIAQFGVKREGASVSAVASVKNGGASPHSLKASLYAEEQLAAVQTVELAPDGQASLRFTQLPSADWYRLDIGRGDAMLADNVSYAFPEGGRAPRALLVGSGNLFLEKALQLAGVEVTRLLPSDMATWIGSSGSRGAVDLVVLDSVARSELAAPGWQEFLASRPIWYIRSGYEGAETAVAPGSYAIEEHPVTRYLSFADVHIAAALQPQQLDWGKPVIAADGSPLVVAGAENGQPRLLLTFSLQQSDLPLRAEFPVLIQNAVTWLTASAGEALGRAVAGEPLEIAMLPDAVEAGWTLLGGGRAELAAERSGAGLSSMQTAPGEPGLYRLEERGTDGETLRARWLGVIADARESGGAVGELAFTRIGAEGEAGGGAQTESGAPYALWPWLVVLVLGVVVWEWEVYRRGSSV